MKIVQNNLKQKIFLSNKKSRTKFWDGLSDDYEDVI